MPNSIEQLRARLLTELQTMGPGRVIMTAKDIFGSQDPEVKAATAAWHKGIEHKSASLYPLQGDDDAKG